jgi:hypothetical protein
MVLEFFSIPGCRTPIFAHGARGSIQFDAVENEEIGFRAPVPFRATTMKLRLLSSGFSEPGQVHVQLRATRSLGGDWGDALSWDIDVGKVGWCALELELADLGLGADVVDRLAKLTEDDDDSRYCEFRLGRDGMSSTDTLPGRWEVSGLDIEFE